MPVAIETFHHALGTVVEGDTLDQAHPIVIAVPHLFTRHEATTPAPVKAAAKKAGK